MNNDRKDVVFIGGDMRMVYAADRMSIRNSCALSGFDALDGIERKGMHSARPGGKYDAAVLPIFAAGSHEIRCPFANRAYDIGILPVLLRPGAAVFAGRVFPALEKLCAENGYDLYDYLSREELAVMNARLTAEGAVETVIHETQRSVHGSDMLILGFGRIAKLCARYFSALGADVTAAARKRSDLAWISSLGYKSADFADETALLAALGKADIIINTVPAKIITAERASVLRDSAVLVELASVPCTDAAALVRVINAGGLPGRTAPVTAGHIIADTIENILTERSVGNAGS